MSESQFQYLIAQILKFRDERDWSRFHSPKELAIALSIEAAEVMEPMLWKGIDEIEERLRDPDYQQRVKRELGDVLIYCLLLCHEIGIDPSTAVLEKIEENRMKYPVHLSKGSTKKYTEFDS